MAAIKKSNRLRQLVGELKLQLDEDVVLRGVKVADKMVPLDDFPLLVLPGSFIVELSGPKDGTPAQLRGHRRGRGDLQRVRTAVGEVAGHRPRGSLRRGRR